MFTTPKAPKDSCFSEDDFTQKEFDVDTFLQERKKNASLEKMRDDLGTYLKILRSAMIELINRDYVDFVNLSSNLIGIDKAIKNLESPLGQLRVEVLQVQQYLDDVITELMSTLNKNSQIREQQRSFYSLIRVQKSIFKMNSILSSDNSLNDLFQPDILERASTEFNQLKFHISRCTATDLDSALIKRSDEFDKLLTQYLNQTFLKYIDEKDPILLTRCLRIYVNLDKIVEAENLVRLKFLEPKIERIIDETNLQSEPLGLQGIYKKLENVLDRDLSQLLDITSCPERLSINGFNFLVNSFWTAVEERIEQFLTCIFAPGNPKLFHKRYTETRDFLLNLKKRCASPEIIESFKNHPQYIRFLKKWNLPVYYQIRFQEIAGTLESVLCTSVCSSSIKRSKSNIDKNEFSLHGTIAAWDCMLKTLADDVFLPQLLHRFWKLNLQIFSRYNKWCRDSLKQTWLVETMNESSAAIETVRVMRLDFLVSLYTDIEKLVERLPILSEIMQRKLENLSVNIINLLNDCLEETKKSAEETLPLINEEIIKELLSESAPHLKQISDIPRLFRRTNREIPTKPCGYVKNSLNFAFTFHADYSPIIPEKVHFWLLQSLSSLTEQYTSSVIDVLTSVQRTEESLRRLKKIRDKSAGVPPSENQGVTDDAKIRIQLSIDVANYLSSIESLGFSRTEVPRLLDLIQAVEAAVKSRGESK